jgi:hypothetical protein
MADGGFAVLDMARHPVAAGTAPGLQRIAEDVGLSCTAAVMTAQGLRPAGRLRPGDRVLTRDRGFRPLRGIAAVASADGEAVRIAAGALGRDLPQADLLLAPEQLVMLRRTGTGPVMGGRDVMVAAGELVGLPGIEPAPRSALVLLTLDDPALIWTEGAWCASAPTTGDPAARPALQRCAPGTRLLA